MGDEVVIVMMASGFVELLEAMISTARRP